MLKLLKDTINFYKSRKQEINQRRKLLGNKSDWGMIEKFVQQINKNPNLAITINLKDGTKIIMKTYEKIKKPDYEMIDGVIYDDK